MAVGIVFRKLASRAGRAQFMIVLDGKSIDVPGLETISWLEDPRRVPR
jgi:hypothetical protein